MTRRTPEPQRNVPLVLVASLLALAAGAVACAVAVLLAVHTLG
jgi:hypothetical protein